MLLTVDEPITEVPEKVLSRSARAKSPYKVEKGKRSWTYLLGVLALPVVALIAIICSLMTGNLFLKELSVAGLIVLMLTVINLTGLKRKGMNSN